MKADVQSAAEKEALEWATEFFRKRADEMDPENSALRGRVDRLSGLLFLYDKPLPGHKAQAEEDIQHFLFHALMGRKEAAQHMRDFAADLIARGDPLPNNGLRGFIVDFLCHPDRLVPYDGELRNNE